MGVPRKTTEEFKRELNDIFGDQFELLSEYVNNHTKVLLRCNRCGNIIEKVPFKMTSGKEGCYICSGKNHYKTKETLQEEVDAKFGREYDIIGEYVRARQPLIVRHNVCGRTYKVTPDNLLRGKRCPLCCPKHSSYMEHAENVMHKLGINYEREYHFDGCRGKSGRVLLFDYYIPSLNMCIEIDGELHYTNNELYDLEYALERDRIKDDFCANNNIKMLRVPYTKIEQFEDMLLYELQANTEITG